MRSRATPRPTFRALVLACALLLLCAQTLGAAHLHADDTVATPCAACGLGDGQPAALETGTVRVPLAIRAVLCCALPTPRLPSREYRPFSPRGPPGVSAAP